jgi:hypothetical protein
MFVKSFGLGLGDGEKEQLIFLNQEFYAIIRDAGDYRET